MTRFLQTFERFAAERAVIDKRQTRSCSEMRALGISSRKLISESRDLIMAVDLILVRDASSVRHRSGSHSTKL